MRRTLLLLMVTACSSDDPAMPPDDPQPPDPSNWEIRMTASIAPGEEVQFCRYVVPPPGGMDVGRFEHRYTEGSHHLLLYETGLTVDEAAAMPDVFDCLASIELGITGMVYGSQDAVGELPYPPGVAFHIPEGEVLLMQSHYLNSTDHPIDAEVRVTMHPAGEGDLTYAGSLFYYDPFIVIPGDGTFTARMHCDLPETVTILAAAPHMHKRGVAFRSWLLDESGEREEMHMSGDWTQIEPSVYLPEGRTARAGQAIEYECDYQNDRADSVVQGPSAESNEMCMFVGIYYPRLDGPAERCMGAGSGTLMEGTKTCGETLACAQSAGADDVAQQSCWLDTCAASRGAANDFAFCLYRRCPSCFAGDASCPACVIDGCAPEYNACASATCD